MTAKRASLAATGALAAAAVAAGGYFLASRPSSPPAGPRLTLAAPSLFVAPGGSDSNPCTQAAPCASWNAAYQAAPAGATVQVAAGTYPGQVIAARAALNGLACTPATASGCVHFVGTGVTVSGPLEIHGSDLWVDGGETRGGPYGITVTGYVDTESQNSTTGPDHVVVSGVHSTSFGVFNASTVTFMDMDVGPATVSTGCAILQGPGFENKIGYAGGVTVEPTNVTLDGLVIHDQNGDSGRIASDCHFGGLFLVTANGLTVQNTIFQGNVVYNVQIQNYAGPPATNVVFNNDSFGCPVNWLYQNNNPLACDGQSSIQFDGTFPGITIENSAFGEALPAWGCYVGTCDYSGDTFTGNTSSGTGVVAPPLPNGGGSTTTVTTTTASTTTTTPTTTTTTPTTTASTTTVVSSLNLHLALITVRWTSVPGATGYNLYRDSVLVSTAGSKATSAQFSIGAGSHTFTVSALNAQTQQTVTVTSG